jgi:hypothetical protein
METIPKHKFTPAGDLNSKNEIPIHIYIQDYSMV